MSEVPAMSRNPTPEVYHHDDPIGRAPLPTRRTLWLRRSIPWQLVRFVVINVRMGWLAMRGHR